MLHSVKVLVLILEDFVSLLTRNAVVLEEINMKVRNPHVVIEVSSPLILEFYGVSKLGIQSLDMVILLRWRSPSSCEVVVERRRALMIVIDFSGAKHFGVIFSCNKLRP
jgi:hypothetical protein